MSDLTIFARAAIAWVKNQYPQVIKAAMVNSGKIAWKGIFSYGDTVAKGSVVVYTSRVFLAIRDNKDSIPKVGSKDWYLLVDLRSMKLADNKLPLEELEFPALDESNQNRYIASHVARHTASMLYEKALNEPINGTHQWRGIFSSKGSYGPGEIVAFRNSVYISTTGKGVPGEGSGWAPLHVTGAVGHGKDMNYLFDGSTGQLLVTEDGEPLVYT